MTTCNDWYIVNAYSVTIPSNLVLWHPAICDKHITGLILTSGTRCNPLYKPSFASKMCASILITQHDLVHNDLVQLPSHLCPSTVTASLSTMTHMSSYHTAYTLKRTLELFSASLMLKVFVDNKTGHRIK